MVLGAVQSSRDPVEVLGLNDHPFTPHVAALVLELQRPPRDETNLTEAELDEQAAQTLARMDRRDRWRAATHGTYKGPRGQHRPPPNSLHRP